MRHEHSSNGRREGSRRRHSNAQLLSKVDCVRLSGGSASSGDSQTRSLASSGFLKGHTPLETPLLDDDPKSNENLGCEDRYALNIQDVGSLRKVLGIPPEYDIKVLRPRDDCHNPASGHFTLFLEYFTGGLSFPPQPLLVEWVESLGDRFDFAAIQARKATVGRRSPLAGDSRAPVNRAVHDFRDPIRRGIPLARSEHVCGSGSNSQKKTNYSPSSKTVEIRPANGGGGEAKKRSHEGVQKKIDDEMQKNPKRIRADDEGAPSKTSRVKHIFGR
ncbi:uncharacterized protein [Primulina eburnea]|uniref:uncharacterized protein n=1 Tax=Primulina eburnea TaxID=1245227 RepID=UPI003C6BDE16